MIISIVAAMARNRVIGVKNSLPWKIDRDMKKFKEITMGKPVIMGRKTSESIGRALPGRDNIVITNDKAFKIFDCRVCHSVEEALKLVKDCEEVMIIGGASIYKQFLPMAQRMYLTLIDDDFEGDSYFPDYNSDNWIEIERLEDKTETPHLTFVTLKRAQFSDVPFR